MQITNDILAAFGLQGEIRPLGGGQNTSVRVQDAVLKPVDNNRYHEWVAGILDQLNPQGYRVSKPIRSIDGSYVDRGWCCTRYEPGEHKLGEIKRKLTVARALHRDLANLQSGVVPASDDPWTRAHRIVWGSDPLPLDVGKVARSTLARLLREVGPRPAGQPEQIVHSDLSGNILFHDSFAPLVIDFSPTIAPIEYAEAILVCDCIAWEGSPLSDLKLLPATDLYREMIIRAVIFRLGVTALVAGGDDDRFLAEYRGFEPIVTGLAIG